jgi:hypothetical protein
MLVVAPEQAGSRILEGAPASLAAIPLGINDQGK